MITILKNPITYLLILELVVISINFWIVREDKKTNKKIKRLSLTVAIILSALILIQGFIQIRNTNYQKSEISDVEIKIEFTIDPDDIKTITTKQEFYPYLRRLNVIEIEDSFLRKLEIYKSEILHEILRDWSISISTNPRTNFNSHYLDNISNFKFKNVLAGIYSFHLKCEMTYILQSKRDLDLSNLKELNENGLYITIISNPLISDLIIDNIQVEFNTKNSPISSDTKLKFTTGLKEVIPQENNALEKIGLDSISQLINLPKTNNRFPLNVYTKRGDALWVWRVEKEFEKNEY